MTKLEENSEKLRLIRKNQPKVSLLQAQNQTERIKKTRNARKCNNLS